jgi:phosphonoacetate hydrolase
VVFGHSKDEREKLPADYRSHGSGHELKIPGFVYRYAGELPPADTIVTNVDLCRFLYQ